MKTDIHITLHRSVLLTMKNVSDKSCRENQNTHLMLNNFFFFFENGAVYEIMCKVIQRWAGHRRQYGACSLHAG